MTLRTFAGTILPIIFFLISGCYADRALDRPPQKYKRVKCQGTLYFVKNICDDEKAYLQWAAKYPKYKKFSSLNKAVLKKITHETRDVDKAAALFYQRAVTEPRNRDFLRYLERREKYLKKRPNPDFSKKKVMLAMVPGMFYEDNPETGADGKAVRDIARGMGLGEAIIPIKQDGTVLENARIICDYLAKDQGLRGIILASASKGGGDIKMAVDHCGREKYFRKVIGWFNIGGITAGNLLINRLTGSFWHRMNLRSYFCWQGYNWAGFMSARAGDDAPLAKSVSIPKHVLVVNVIGVPLFRHVTPRARPYYNAFVPEGPSDGIVLLAESFIPGGVIYPSFRNDHYFQWALTDLRMKAMLSYIIDKQT